MSAQHCSLPQSELVKLGKFIIRATMTSMIGDESQCKTFFIFWMTFVLKKKETLFFSQ